MSIFAMSHLFMFLILDSSKSKKKNGHVFDF